MSILTTPALSKRQQQCFLKSPDHSARGRQLWKRNPRTPLRIRYCVHLNGGICAMPRGSLGQMEFPNLLDCPSRPLPSRGHGQHNRSVEAAARHSLNVAPLLEEIDGDQRGDGDCSYHRSATHDFAREPEIVKRDASHYDRDVACYKDRAGNCHQIELAFHVARRCAPPSMNTLDRG
jgi:hypothetical protein